MGNVGGYLPSAQANQGLVNALVAMSQLQESRRRGDYLTALQEETTAKRKLETEKLGREIVEKDISQRAVGAWGQPTTEPEVQQALSPIRQALSPGGTVTVPQNYVQMEPPMETRAPTQRDIRDITDWQGNVVLRGDALARLRALGVPETDPRYKYLESSQQVPLASKMEAYIKESAGARQADIKTEEETFKLGETKALAPLKRRTEEAQATTAESGARVATATEATDIARKKAESQKSVVEAAYIEGDKQLAQRKVQLENALNSEKLRNAPLERAKLQREISNLDTQIAQRNQQIQKERISQGLSAAYAKETDPVKRKEIVRQHAMHNGHSGQLLTEDNDNSRLVMQLNDKAADLDKQGYLLSKESATNPQVLPLAKQTWNHANGMRVEAAQRNNSNTVKLTTANVVPEGMFGTKKGVATGTVIVPTQVGADYTSGKLTDMVLNPDIKTPEGINRAAGHLAWLTYIDNAFAGTDPTAYAKAISDSSSPPEVKAAATQKLSAIMKASPAVAGPSAGGASETAMPAAGPLPTDVARGAPARVQAEQRGEAEAQQREARLTRERDMAVYVARRAREAGITPTQASPAQIAQWQREYRGATLRAVQ